MTEGTCAHTGSEAISLVASALRSQPYTLAIVDLVLRAQRQGILKPNFSQATDKPL